MREEIRVQRARGRAGKTCIQSSELMGFELGQDVETIEVEPQRPIHDHSETGPMDDYFRYERDGDAGPS